MSGRMVGLALAALLVAAGGVALAKGGKGKKGSAAPPAAAQPLLLVAVAGADGTPAAGAHVVLLRCASTNAAGDWLPSASGSGTADPKGTAALSSSSDPVCLLAWTEKDAGFVCNEPLRKPPETMAVTLEPGLRLAGRILGPDGKPVAGARVRVRVPGGYEWHHFDAAVAADGAFTLPTLPASLVHKPPAVIEFAATGFATGTRPLGPDATDAPIEIRFAAARRVIGRLVGADGRPVVQGAVWTDDWTHGPHAAADAQGVFDFGPLADDVRTVHVLSKSHADLAIDVPAGGGVQDLGDVKLAAGTPVRVHVTERDGAKILRAFVVLHDSGDFRIGRMEGPGPDFEFPHVGDGVYVLHVWVHEVEGVKSWREVVRKGVRAGGEAIDVEMPSGLVVRLVDAAGKPARSSEVRLSCEIPGRDHPWTETFQAMRKEPEFAEIRFGPMPPSCRITVTVTAKGHAPVVVPDVEIDGDGCGVAVATVR